MMFNRKLSAAVIIGLLLVQAAHAQNKVVVIPMAGSDVAMAQQNIRYYESNNIGSGTEAFMCISEAFSTPSQATQVLLVANANARFSADSAYWYLKIQVSKNSDSFSNISTYTAYAGATSDAWSQISTTDILDLDPNSSYRFRLRLKSGSASFTSSFFEYCELVVSATYKLPAGKSILEVSP